MENDFLERKEDRLGSAHAAAVGGGASLAAAAVVKAVLVRSDQNLLGKPGNW